MSNTGTTYNSTKDVLPFTSPTKIKISCKFFQNWHKDAAILDAKNLTSVIGNMMILQAEYTSLINSYSVLKIYLLAL